MVVHFAHQNVLSRGYFGEAIPLGRGTYHPIQRKSLPQTLPPFASWRRERLSSPLIPLQRGKWFCANQSSP
jgi:hypothetical protein